MSSDFRFMIDESSVLNKNLSLIVVDERHTVETCQNTPKFNLTLVLQIRQKSEASLLSNSTSLLPGFFRVLFIKFKINTVVFLQFLFRIVD